MSAPSGSTTLSGSLFFVRPFQEDGRDLVEKRILPRFVREPEARAALAREAHVLSAVRHSALPELVRVGADDKGPFVVETLATGQSIRHLVEWWSSRGGVPARLAAHVTRSAFAALAELAELSGPDAPLGFVHGDITPEHVILGPHGELRLVDFGAARVATLPPALAGDARGTLPFVAPEVARGEAPASAAGDVYALAATALQLASGEALCAARDEAAMLLEVGSRGVRAELMGALAVFGRAGDALRRALALDPAQRVASAAEIVAAFE